MQTQRSTHHVCTSTDAHTHGCPLSTHTHSETAADVVPGGDPSKAYGACTYSLNNLLRDHMKETGEAITYR